MTRQATWVSVAVLWSGLCSADTGALKPVAGDLDCAFLPTILHASVDGKPGPDAGPLSSRAMVGTAKGKGRKNPLSVRLAVDYSSAKAKEPDLLYLDFSGEGRFEKKSAVPMRPARDLLAPKQIAFQATIDPTVTSVQRGGTAVPVRIRGTFVRIARGRKCMAILTFSTAMEGSCTFGDKRYLVRLVDMTGDFAFDHRGTYDRKDRRGEGLAFGDMVLVDTGDGSFRGSVVKAYYGQPVFVGGSWYQVTISSDGTKVSARPVRRKTGYVSIDSNRWQLMLADGKRAFCIGGGKEPVAMPVGGYSLLCYRQWSAPDKQAQRATLLAGLQEVLTGKVKGRSVTVAPGETVRLPYGTPLTAVLKATVDPERSVKLSFESTRIRGDLSVLLITRPGGWLIDRPSPPDVEVHDPQGKIVHRWTLEYG